MRKGTHDSQTFQDVRNKNRVIPNPEKFGFEFAYTDT